MELSDNQKNLAAFDCMPPELNTLTVEKAIKFIEFAKSEYLRFMDILHEKRTNVKESMEGKNGTD